MRARKAFTLIEMLVVMSIIIILTSLLAIGLMGARDKARHKASMALVSKIKIALESYFADFREYPPDGYDNEGTWVLASAKEGVKVGTPQRPMKGTALLMYFLCRPLVKVSFIGADVNDPRNRILKRVGPYLSLQPENYSMPRKDRDSGEPEVFDPAYNWEDNEYWEDLGFKFCELVDGYGRPLCYDKVKTSDLPPPAGTGKYWDPSRFQNPGGILADGTGQFVHPDREYFDSGMIGILPDIEPEGYQNADPADILKWRFDPRFRNPPLAGQPTWDSDYLIDNYFKAGTDVPAGNANSHAPRYSGGYDLWAPGRSWIDPRDDIKSWE